MVRAGHRDVRDEQVSASLKNFCSAMPQREEDLVTRQSFQVFLLKHGLIVDGVDSTAVGRRVQQTRLADKTTFHVYQGSSQADYTSF